MGHNCLLLLCQLHIILACDILPGHHALYPPIVPRVQAELVCLLSWHLYVAFNFLEVKKPQATQPSSPLCPALFKSALSLLAQLTSALQCRKQVCIRRNLKQSVQQGFKNVVVLLKRSCLEKLSDSMRSVSQEVAWCRDAL